MNEPSLPAHAAPGSVLGSKYRIERVIGRGGMGLVLQATHLTLGKRVAVKMLLSQANPTATARFQREAQVAARIESAHVAQVLDFGVADGLPYLVMEYLTGHDLEAELEKRGRLTVPEACDLVLEACVGVAQAHAHGLVHRDLKPANLFVSLATSGKRTIKVLDFGLSKTTSGEGANLTSSSEAFGTPQYMAPEQIQSSKNVDARCDQHAMGMVLFEFLTGRPPYVADSLPQLIVKIATEPPLRASELGIAIPPALDDVVQRTLSKRPADRFATIAHFASALVPFASAKGAEFAAEIVASMAAAAPPGQDAAFGQTVAPGPGSAQALGPSAAGAWLAPGSRPEAPVAVEANSNQQAPPLAAGTGWMGPTVASVQVAPSPLAPIGSLSAGALSSVQASPPEAMPPSRAGVWAAVASAATIAVIAVVYFAFLRGPASQAAPESSAAPQAATQTSPTSVPTTTAAAVEAPTATAQAATSAPSASASASARPGPSAVARVPQPRPVKAPTKVCKGLDCY